MSKAVLVCAAHPDDEMLGCGGTIARHAADGDEVHVVLFGQGVLSRAPGGDQGSLDRDRLRAAAHAASDAAGVKSLVMHDFPDNKMDLVARLDLARIVEDAIAATKPQIVYTHHHSDLNVDHVRVNEAVCIAARPEPGQCVRAIYCFEVASSTGWRPDAAFTPNHFVDISSTMPAKLAALRCYDQEMRPWPHARSLQALEHLARWRGATVGVEAAEAFVVARQLVTAEMS